jgi:transcriptional regulator with XRE-family HTH domain
MGYKSNKLMRMNLLPKDEYLHIDIGKRLERFRLVLNLNQREFAERHGFNPTQYRNWESGSRRISIDCAALLEERYGLTLDFIYLGRISTLPHKLAIELSERPLDIE